MEAGIFAAFLAMPACSEADEYRLQPSDVIELSVAGIEGLRQRAAVDVDGNIVLPIAGEMNVEGRTLAEVRNEFNKHLTSKSYDAQTSDGLTAYFIDPDQVTIVVAEYRPVYITGDVARPGEQPFRPGLTVRQAIAVAGGYDLLRFSADNPFLQSATLRADYDTLWIQFAEAQSTLARLVAELTGKEAPDGVGFSDLPVDEELLTDLARSEAEQMKIRLAEIDNEKSYLQRLITQNQNRFELLSQEQTQVKDDRDADERDLQRIRGLFEKGITTADRMTAARQALFNSSVRFLSTTAELGEISDSLEGFRRQLEKVDADRRLELLGQLKEEKVALAKAISGLGAVSEKLLYVGSTRSTVDEGLAGVPRILVFDSRDVGKGRIADESELLSPGDLIKVTLELPPIGQALSSTGLPDEIPPTARAP